MVIFSSFLCASVLLFGSCGYDAQNIKVIKVFGGDTVKLANGEKVRLIGIDTPEAYESDKLFRESRRSGMKVAEIMRQGQRASSFTRELLLGKRIRVEYDIEKKDKYGRTLAYIWFEVAENSHL